MPTRPRPQRPAPAPSDGALVATALSRAAQRLGVNNKTLARVVGLSGSGLSRLDPGQPLQRLGLDSLMAIELKNRIEADLSVIIPLGSFLHGANLRQVSAQVLDQVLAAAPEAVATGGDGGWEEGEFYTVTPPLSRNARLAGNSAVPD